jgi:hypothetical protein
MAFCSECNTFYDLSKKVDNNLLQTGGKYDENKIIDMLLNKQLIDPEVLSTVDLKKNDKFNKLQTNEKHMMNNILENYNKKSLDGGLKDDVYYNCFKCGHIEKLQSKELVYSDTINPHYNTTNIDMTYLKHDSTLPITSQYDCYNKKCPTVKNSELKKAIFVRQKNSYGLIYQCLVCSTAWK